MLVADLAAKPPTPLPGSALDALQTPCMLLDEGRLRANVERMRAHSNPIESVFATVRHRTMRTKGARSPTTANLMVFKLVIAAAKTWRRLNGENQLPKVVAGVTFRDGTEVTACPDHRAA